MQTFIDFFGIQNFMPHGFCLSWNPILLWLHVASDLLITLSYYSIPLSLAYFIRKRKDLTYAWLILMFGLFIVACGTTHLMSAVLIWIPLYWLDGYLKVFTAIISMATAIAMWRIIPLALKLPSAEQLQAEINERKNAELAQQEVSERLYKIANQLPNVVLQFRMRADGSFCIPYANEVLRDVYRLSPEEVREDASAIFDVTHPDDLACHIEKIKTSAQELSPWSDQYRLKFEDGTERWLWGSALPQREADGSTLWHGFVMDISKQKQIEIKLRESENKLSTILDSVDAFIYIKDMQSRYQYANRRARQRFDLPLEAIIGKNDDDFFPSETAIQLRENDRKVIESGEPLSVEEVDTFSGITYLATKQPLYRDDGTIYGLCGISTNITERKRMEDRLKASEQRLSEIINLMPIAVFIKDTESRVTMMNNICEFQWGVRISELQNTTGSHIFPPEQMEVFLAADKKIFADGETFEIEELIWNAELQTNRIIHTYKKPVFNEMGEPDYLIGISVDVTEARQQEKELKESEQRLNLSQEYGGIGSWEADLISGANIWSNSLFELVKLPVSEKVTWDDFLAIVYPDDRQKVIDAIQKHLINQVKYDVEYRVILANGDIHWMRSAGRAQFSDDGTPIKFIGIAQDVTERHTLEAELKRSNADLEQFAYAVSHDMRQPLRMISSYLSLIETALQSQLDEDTRQFLTFAIEGAKRMDSMILSLLDYSHVGRSTEALTVISSRAAVDEALLFLKAALETSGGTVEIFGDWIDLVASRDELTRLFQNLIGNALKYHDENKPPRIAVSASVTSKVFRVEVRDNGIGINPNQIDRLFKVFSRLQARSRFEGTGIGLALCRKIVEHHGGTIGVESTGEGQGCTFWFELPRKLPTVIFDLPAGT